jgi:anti-sigma regulatory factor (Ser/Thr protein kinase)
MATELSVEIPRTAQAPFVARRALADLEGKIDPSVLPDVRLLVSELISNSVKYGGDGEVRLQMRSDGPNHVRIEVVDQGSGFVPVARDRPATDVGGWGLHLVETLSRRWGVREGSTNVWFELAATPGA